MTRITFRRGHVLTGPVLVGPVLVGTVLVGTVLLGGCLAISACSGTASPSSASAGVGTVHRAQAGGPVNGTNPGSAGPRGALSQNEGSAQPTAKLTPASQSIIYTAGLTIRSASAMATAKRVTAIVTAAGGYTSSENAVASQHGGTVSLQVKVPVTAYAQVLTELSAPSLGKQIKITQNATDVTQQVANVNSLVTSEQDAIAALQSLLKHAASVSSLLQVQQQISNDESYLQSLQAQQRALDHETSYATITLTLLSTSHPAKSHRHAARHGFLGGLAAGWHALGHATVLVLTALGAALPFLIVVVILAGLAYDGRRRFVRRKAGPTAAG
jgi:hypothetical protein